MTPRDEGREALEHDPKKCFLFFCKWCEEPAPAEWGTVQRCVAHPKRDEYGFPRYMLTCEFEPWPLTAFAEPDLHVKLTAAEKREAELRATLEAIGHAFDLSEAYDLARRALQPPGEAE